MQGIRLRPLRPSEHRPLIEFVGGEARRGGQDVKKAFHRIRRHVVAEQRAMKERRRIEGARREEPGRFPQRHGEQRFCVHPASDL